MTNPIFNHPLTDKHDDTWPQACCACSEYTLIVPSAQRFARNESDQFIAQGEIETQEKVKPTQIAYSIEFWSSLNKKQNGSESRAYTREGKEVFEVDLGDPALSQIYDNGPEKYEDAIMHLIIWHFRNKVTV